MIYTLQQGQFGRTLKGVTGGAGLTYRSRLQFGGADASTTFTDDTGKIWTPFGNAQIDTSLGDQRALFDGASDYITTPNHTDLEISSSETWKIMFTMRFNSKAGFQTIVSKGYAPLATANSWLLQTDNGNGRLIFYTINAGGGTGAIATESSGTINTGQDYDIEIERFQSGADFYTRIMRNSVQVAISAANAGNHNLDSNTQMVIGGGSATGFNNFWYNGWIKDFRFMF